MATKPVREPIGIWWMIVDYRTAIAPVKVVDFTEKTVTYLWKWSFVKSDPPRERRASRKDIYQTFAEAKAEALRRVDARIDSLKQQLQNSWSERGQIESLREPKSKEAADAE